MTPSTADRVELDRLLARLRFRHLQLLAAIDETGSLRAAAQRLHLTQPALSKALGELEAMLGFKLFERTARGLARTARGEVAVQGAHVLIEELAHVRQEALATGPEGQAATLLRLGMPQFVAVTVLPQLVALLWRVQPPVRLLVRESNAPQLFEDLKNGVVDALITVYSRDAVVAAAGKTFHYERVADGDFAVIAPPAHPLAARRTVSWEQLAAEPWIVTIPPSVNRQLLEQAFLGAGVVPPVPVIESDSPVTNVRLVAKGHGIALVPGAVMREACAAGAVCRLRVAPELQGTSVGMVCRAAALPHPRIRALREALQALRVPGSTPLRLR